MPSKFNVSQEYCFPCKYHVQAMMKSGQHPIYNMYCEHPDAEADRPDYPYPRGKHGKFIGENDENRPQWCPIRGNKQAEQEAEGGD